MGHFYAPDEVFDLPVSGYAKLILLNLCRRANKAGSSFPSKNRIASDCGISNKTVYNCIKELEEMKIIRKNTVIGKSNTYVLCDGFVNVKSNGNENEPRSHIHGCQVSLTRVPRSQLPTKDYTEKEYTYKEVSNINKQLNRSPNADELSVMEIDHYLEQWIGMDWDCRKMLDFEASQLVPHGSGITFSGRQDPVLNKYRALALMRREKACTRLVPIISAV